MIFEVKELSKKIGAKNLKLDFKLSTGDILVFLGANGAGKTTSLKLISGCLTKDSGDIFLNGKSIFANLSVYQKNIGYASESLEFNRNLTVTQALTFIAKLRLPDSPKLAWRLEAIIDELQLTSILQQKIGNLSRGYKQRLVLAANLIHQPQILLLDEATQGLDIMQKQQIYALLQNSSKRISIISTHDLSEAILLASKIVIIDNFTTLFYGDKTELLSLADKHAADDPNHDIPSNKLDKYLYSLNKDRQKYAN